MTVMTKKRRAAILQYARLQCAHTMTIDSVVEQTLKARQMSAVDLYRWLTRHGYIWRTRFNRWDVKK